MGHTIGRSEQRLGRRVASGFVVAALALAACGSDTTDQTSDPAPTDQAVSDTATPPEVDSAAATESRTVYGGVGSLSSEYWSAFSAGAGTMSDSLDNGSSYEALGSEYDGQRHLDQFSTILSQGCDDCILVIDPASAAFTQAIVGEAVAAGVPTMTLWNKPDDYNPWDEDSGLWVAHTSFDGVDSGYRNAVALFDSMGGEGNIVALQGILDNPPAIQRFAGLQQALEEYPGITLLEDQVGNWSQSEGQSITESWLTRYGDDIGGVWTANDGMALGAVEALRQAGRAGEVLVTGSDGGTDALELIASGEMVSTMFIDGRYQGAVASALTYAVATGQLDVADLSEDQRSFFLDQTLVTADNVDEFLNADVDDSLYTYEAISADFWARSAGPIG